MLKVLVLGVLKIDDVESEFNTSDIDYTTAIPVKLYTYPQKNKYFLAKRLQTTVKLCNFWHSDSIVSGNVFFLTCVLPIPGKMFHTRYILTANKTVTLYLLLLSYVFN